MQAQKIPAGNIHQWVMRGENNIFREHGAMRRAEQGTAFAALDAGYRRVLIYRQPLCHGEQKFQRLEPCLIFKAQCRRNGNGKFGSFRDGTVDARLPAGEEFELQPVCGTVGVQVGRAPGKSAICGKGTDDGFISVDGGKIGLGVALGDERSPVLRQGVIKQVMLCREFRGGASGLPGTDTVFLQNQNIQPFIGEKPGSQDARHAAADHGCVTFAGVFQYRTGRGAQGVGPNRWL